MAYRIGLSIKLKTLGILNFGDPHLDSPNHQIYLLYGIEIIDAHQNQF